ncbi:hypothetical protein BELL_1468g00010 [Botrytis elliptica]|uniref:Amidoligase enzyme n=1 Tax=Botrytis elliptica TaxID=278938 RepID=A0A4Z1IEV8_9HELO|nr:hypothetical protein EAE99_003872 [Botrytis elliptica]TGO55187.1 hypothetical protein BELL_1468g00010 [Botrytis elliptica]
MNIVHVPKKTPVSPDTPSFGIEFEFLIAVLAKPSIENPNPSDPRTVYFPSTPEDNAPAYFRIPVGKEDWANEWSIYAHIKRSLASIGLPTELEKAHSNFAMWEITRDGSITPPKPPHRRHKKAYADWQAYTYYPIEVRTPAYYYCEDALRDIADFCKIMRKNYLVTVNKSCGLHVHVGYGTQGFTLPHLRRLGAMIQAFEPQFDSIHPEHRIDSRNDHCVSFRGNTYFQWKYKQDFNRSPRVLETIATLLACESRDAFRTCVASEGAAGAHSFVGHKTAWNFDRMGTETRPRDRVLPDTIEFRGHEASLDAEVVGNWVRVLVGLVEYSRSPDPWGFGELLSRVKGEKWEGGERNQRITGRGRYEPGGVMYRPVFGEEWCGLVDLLRVLKLEGPALYYENRKGRWLENGVYNHWYTQAPSEYVIPVDEDHNDNDNDNDDNNDDGEDDQSSPSSKSSSGSKSGRFDPFNPNPITPEKPVEKPEEKKPEGVVATPVDLSQFDIDVGFSDPSSSPSTKVSHPQPPPEPSSAKPSSKKSDSPESFPTRPNPGVAIEIPLSDVSSEKPDVAESKPTPTPRTGFRVPSSSSSSSTNSSTESVSLTLSHYEREAAKARAFTAKFWQEENKRGKAEAVKKEEERKREFEEKAEKNRKKSSMDIGSERAPSDRSTGSKPEFTDLGPQEEEVWKPEGWRGVDGEEVSEETKVLEEEKKRAEEQTRQEELIRNLKPGIGYLKPVRHPPLRALPGAVKFTKRTQDQHSHLLQGTTPEEIEALAPNTSNFLGRPFHRLFRAPSSPFLEYAPSGAGMDPNRNPYPGPVPFINEYHAAALTDALESTIGEPWSEDHELLTRSAGLARMLRGRQLYEVSPTIKKRLLGYNFTIDHRNRGTKLQGLFPARAHTVEEFEAADDRWWRGQLAEGEIVRLEGLAASSDEGVALTALEMLELWRRGDAQYLYEPEGVQNPFSAAARTQVQVEEDVSPGEVVFGPETDPNAIVPARNPRIAERRRFRDIWEADERARRKLEEEEEEEEMEKEIERIEAEKKRRMEFAIAKILKAREEAAEKKRKEEEEEEEEEEGEEEEEEEEEEEDTTSAAPEPENSWQRGDEGGFGTA